MAFRRTSCDTCSQFTWACWANCTDECWDLTQAFSEGSEHLSVWYAAYTEPVSRAFKPALTQKTSDDPLRDKRDFISSFAIVNMVLQQCTGRNLAFKFKKAYICLKKIHLGCFLRWNLKENITFLSCFPSFIFVQYGELNITHKLFQCKHSLHRNCCFSAVNVCTETDWQAVYSNNGRKGLKLLLNVRLSWELLSTGNTFWNWLMKLPLEFFNTLWEKCLKVWNVNFYYLKNAKSQC